MSLRIRNTLARGLAARVNALRDRRSILAAMGAEVVSIARGAFGDPALRPSPWPPRQRAVQPPHPLLRKTGALRDSIRVLQSTGETVNVGSDLPYAAVHQFGSARRKGRGGGIPARPFFPYDAAGNLTPLARRRVTGELRRLLGL
jgi:phage gpG-like protein